MVFCEFTTVQILIPSARVEKALHGWTDTWELDTLVLFKYDSMDEHILTFILLQIVMFLVRLCVSCSDLRNLASGHTCKYNTAV